MPPIAESPLRLLHFDDPPEGWQDVRQALGYPTPDDPIPAGIEGVVGLREGRAVARVAFGARDDFAGMKEPTGFVGWYEAIDAEAGVAVLRHASELLAERGVSRIIGPLNGSTWHRYRLVHPGSGEVAQASSREAFLSEPRNPAAYVDQFTAAGFRPLLEYESRLVGEPVGDPEIEAKVLPGLRERGITIRNLDLDSLEDELRALHRLSLGAFAANPIYSPIDYDDFAAMYLPLRPLLDPALIRLAVDGDGALTGYVFSFTDPLSPAGEPRIVLKTLAASPAARGLGLGRVLVDDINRTARARRHRVIHALMQSGNISRSISRRSASVLFRRYTLYAADSR